MFRLDARSVWTRVHLPMLGFFCAALAACSGGNGSVVLTPTPAGTATATAKPTPSGSATPTAAPTATPTPQATATPTAAPSPSATPTAAQSPLVLSTTLVQFEATGQTSADVGITGPASTNYADMTLTSSNSSVATAAFDGNNQQFTVTSVGPGSATITVVPSDGSAGPATLTVDVETAVIQPQQRTLAGGSR